MEFIELRNIFKVYKNGVSALADVNLTISKGEFVFIIGQSGSGKSTLTKLLYREEKPNRGTVLVGGINVGKLRNGNVYKLRNMRAEAIDCYQTVLENFSDTALAPKARAALAELGVEVTEPVLTEEAEDEE